MEQRVVAVCASAGGVEALGRLLEALPADLAATVLVALHVPSRSPSLLPQVLSRRTRLPVIAATDGLVLEPGCVVVAVPDSHLLVAGNQVVMGTGARENGHRPSHDAMLRSVALAAGPAATGLVLTGLLDDGAAGLRCIERYGGDCLVQDPEEADYPDMPRNALRAVPDARCGPIADLAQEVIKIVSEPPRMHPHIDGVQRILDEAELASALGHPTSLPDGSHPGAPSPFACPDCHGVLNEIADQPLARFRCRTGHAWTAESLVVQQGLKVEEALWTALRALEERADMSRRMADRAEIDGRPWSGSHHRQREREANDSAATLRDVLSTAIEEAPVVADGG